MLTSSSGSHPLVAAETNCLTAYGGWLRTTAARPVCSAACRWPSLARTRSSAWPSAVAIRLRSTASLALLIELGKLAIVLSDGDYAQAADRNFLVRIDDTVFAGAMRLVGNGEATMANWCIDIRTVLSPDMLTQAELRQAEATGEALKQSCAGQIEQAYTLAKALPIVPARARTSSSAMPSRSRWAERRRQPERMQQEEGPMNTTPDNYDDDDAPEPSASRSIWPIAVLRSCSKRCGSKPASCPRARPRCR